MSSKKKNILMFLSDQLSATALAAWGNTYGNTPNIDKIIGNGVRFDKAYSNCPLCIPSRASLWTGLYPHETKVMSNGRKCPIEDVPESVPTLGAVFSDAGYKAIHFGKTHDSGTLRGFEVVPIEQTELEDESPAWPLRYDSKQDDGTRKQAVNFLETYSDDSPFFAVADLNNPHDICNWIGAFQGDSELISPDWELPELPDNLYRDEGEFEKLPLPVQYICCAHTRQAQVAEWDEEKIRHYLCAYHYYIKRLDDEVGHVLDALEKRGDTEDTLIVLAADHGDSMFGRWMATKHTSFYDETTRVPMIFSGAEVKGEGRSIDGLVSLIDLFPTLCDYAGVNVEHDMSGRSLMPWLAEDKPDSPHEYVASEWHTLWGYTIEPGRMIRTNQFKYTHYLEADGEELYDLENDPGELKNLAHDQNFQNIRNEHRDLLMDHVKKTKDPYFSLEWEAADRWREHKPGYRHHRGIAAPSAGD